MTILLALAVHLRTWSESVTFLKSSILVLLWKCDTILVYFFESHGTFIHVNSSPSEITHNNLIWYFKWLFAGRIDICSFVETVTQEIEKYLLKNIKNPNYDVDQKNCLHKNVIRFPDFVATFSGLNLCICRKYKIYFHILYKIPRKLK